MSDILELLARSNSPTLMAAVIGVLFIVFFREYFRAVIRLRELRNKREQMEKAGPPEQGASEEGNGPESDQRSSAVVGFNFKLLEKYYEQHLVEYKLMARASLVIAILGFLVIVIGVFFSFAGEISVGVITSAAGLVAEAAAALFFKQNNLLIDQVREYHKKLVSTQYLLTSISLASELPEEVAVKQRERIIGNLLFLSNELHGAPSSHLFSLENSEPHLPSASNKSLQPTANAAAASLAL